MGSVVSESGEDRDQDWIIAVCESAVCRLNAGYSRPLMSRRISENPPRDARHLTDTRTRVATLLEYALGYHLNEVLRETSDGLFCSAVLWNVFPDLLIRKSDGTPVFGLEVKALHAAAEEKSANLATPLAVINRRDYVVVLVWSWASGDEVQAAMLYPKVLSVDVFSAWDLARIRDLGWMSGANSRPKGIDLIGPIIESTPGNMKAEEGNLGKLLRIRPPAGLFESQLEHSGLAQTSRRFEAFKSRVIVAGLSETFRDICMSLGAMHPRIEESHQYPTDADVLGSAILEAGNQLGLLAGPRPTVAFLNSLTRKYQFDAAVWLGKTLEWEVHKLSKNSWNRIGNGMKPDSEIEKITHLLRPTQGG